MKKKLFSIAKKYGCTILEFKSYRSDMGVQVFNMFIEFKNGKTKIHNDSYFVGSGDEEKQKLIDYFDSFLKSY